jgi:hypothetical protein
MKLPYRNHISNTLIKQLRIDSTDTTDLKPVGFWYGIKDAWYNFMVHEMRVQPIYIYRVAIFPNGCTNIDKPNKNKILCIKSKTDMIKFIDKYVHIVDRGSHTYDWSLLQSKFGGIEIHNPRDLGEEMFLLTWDVSSGCIWNIDVIKKLTKINI